MAKAKAIGKGKAAAKSVESLGLDNWHFDSAEDDNGNNGDDEQE